MAGLKLKLRPQERVLINGAVIENGPRQSELRVETPNTRILRLRDAMRPEEANTPVKRLYYAAQLVVAGEAEPSVTLVDFRQGVRALREVFGRPAARERLSEALEHAEEGNYYKAMHALRSLMEYETLLLTARPQPAPRLTA